MEVATMSKIDLYDNFIKFPSAEDSKKMGNQMAFLVYATPYVSSIIEYAGRTCYKSFNAINEESYKKFINTVVKSGHESVIEHSNLVYIVFKTNNKSLKQDADSVNRYMINLLMYNGLLNVSENQAFYTISGNIRMFKDLIRKYTEIQKINNKFNPILNDIKKSFYELPEYLFCDMIANGTLDQSHFKLNPKFKEATSTISFNKLNDYISVINHDNFSFKVRGFVTVTDGNSVVKRLNIPDAVLKRHNRLTVVIDAPRYITHQLVRHRMASYSQSSQRYVLEGIKNIYTPQSFIENKVDTFANNFFDSCFNMYNTLLEHSVKKEDARAVLPNATMSTVVMTATIEEFEHFISLRSEKSAQNFIRDIIAIPLKEYLEEYYTRAKTAEQQPQKKNRPKPQKQNKPRIEKINSSKTKEFKQNNPKPKVPKQHQNTNKPIFKKPFVKKTNNTQNDGLKNTVMKHNSNKRNNFKTGRK